MRGRGAAILLLHNISPWITIFPKDRVSREQTQIVSDGARGESLRRRPACAKARWRDPTARRNR
ncbi:hypothetical protein EH245_09075 [Bifidobacterium breve]|nr:hypothetical protein EH245_09075 [Bifidobacterium breve]